MPYDTETAKANLRRWHEAEAERLRAAREQREAEAAAEPERRRLARNARDRARYVPKRRGRRAPLSPLSRERRAQKIREHRHAVRLAAGTASPLSVVRNERKLTQRDLAALAATTRHAVEEAENGREVRAEDWNAWALALGVDVAVIRG